MPQRSTKVTKHNSTRLQSLNAAKKRKGHKRALCFLCTFVAESNNIEAKQAGCALPDRTPFPSLKTIPAPALPPDLPFPIQRRSHL
jgi:hypothetical protein